MNQRRDIGRTVLARSHAWIDRSQYEKIGFTGDRDSYTFDDKEDLDHVIVVDKWVACYSGWGNGSP